MKNKLLFLLSVVSLFLGTSVLTAKTKITFWTMSLKPKFDEHFEQLEKNYEAKNPDIDIVWVDVPWDVLQSKLTAALAAKKAPSLVNLNIPWAYDYVQQGLLEPVDELLGDARDRYAEGSVLDLTFNGKVYGFPFYNGANVVMYNKEIFKKAGLDENKPPSELSELLETAEIIREKTGTAGFAPTLGKIASIFLGEGLPVLENGKAVFNRKEHQDLIKRYKDTYETGAFYSTNLFSEDNFLSSIEGYNAGRLAMMVTAPTALARVRDDAPSIYKNTGVGRAPVKNGIAPGGWLFHFAVPKGSNEAPLSEVGKFALFLTNDEHQLQFSKLAGTFPTTKKAGEDEHFKKMAMSSDPFEKAVGTGAMNMKYIRTLFVPSVEDYATLDRKLQTEVEKSIRGRQSIKEGLDKAVEFWNSRL